MIEQTFSATRCRDTRKPREGECPGVCFYRCEVCGALFPVTRGLGMDAGNEAREIICCGKKAVRLLPLSQEKAGDSLEEDKNKVGEPEKKPDNDGLKNKDSGPKTEKCTGNTDKVDREIEKLKKRKKELESQLRTEEDEGKRRSLEGELAQVERELSQKDNDGYRRQHTVFS